MKHFIVQVRLNMGVGMTPSKWERSVNCEKEYTSQLKARRAITKHGKRRDCDYRIMRTEFTEVEMLPRTGKARR